MEPHPGSRCRRTRGGTLESRRTRRTVSDFLHVAVRIAMRGSSSPIGSVAASASSPRIARRWVNGDLRLRRRPVRQHQRHRDRRRRVGVRQRLPEQPCAGIQSARAIARPVLRGRDHPHALPALERIQIAVLSRTLRPTTCAASAPVRRYRDGTQSGTRPAIPSLAQAVYGVMGRRDVLERRQEAAGDRSAGIG